MLEFKQISRSGHGKGLDIEFEVMVKLWPGDWESCSFVKAQLSIKVRIHSRFLSHIKGMFSFISFPSFLLPHISNKSLNTNLWKVSMLGIIFSYNRQTSLIIMCWIMYSCDVLTMLQLLSLTCTYHSTDTTHIGVQASKTQVHTLTSPLCTWEFKMEINLYYMYTEYKNPCFLKM